MQNSDEIEQRTGEIQKQGGTMTGKFTFSVKAEPDCISFLKIKWPDDIEYNLIDDFIVNYPTPSLKELRLCSIQYRGDHKGYGEYLDEYVAFSERLLLLPLSFSWLITNPTIKAAHYFSEKTADCLQNARLFALKSCLILDPSDTSLWKYGYVSQFHTRCVYFGTATTWYSNTFDQLLQMVYWAYELYTAAKDRDGNMYDESWDAKKIMTCCTYEFVVGELKTRNLLDVRKALTSCAGKIQEVRTWANYIKHKGGIEYLHLAPESPIKIFIMPPGTKEAEKNAPDDRFSIKNFKSPIEIDIDEKITVMENVHIALYECAMQIITAIDFKKHEISLS